MPAFALMDKILDFARGRLGGGLTLVRQENAPLKEVLEQVIAELRVIARDHAIDVHLAIDRPVNCEPTRIDCVTTGDQLELWTANGGAPIPPEALARVFQPFFSGKSGKSQEDLCLGLYIASQIASAYDGELTASSSESETRFTFTMPLAPFE